MRPQVFGILLVQLIVTFGMVVRCPRPRAVPPPILTRPRCAQLGLNQGLESECVRAEGPSGTCKTLYYVSWAVGFGTMIAIFCCKENAKIVPRCPAPPPPLRPLACRASLSQMHGPAVCAGITSCSPSAPWPRALCSA